MPGRSRRLPILLAALGTAVARSGDFAAAAALVAEVDAVCEATGTRAAPFTAIMLACMRGYYAEATRLIEATVAEARAGGQGNAVAYAHWSAAILANGLGRYADALTAARAASEDTASLYISMWALPELIEAAARSGNEPAAAAALKRLTDLARQGRRDPGRPRRPGPLPCVAEPSQAAEGLYREAIDRLGRTKLRPELARARLLYGEWLRGQRSRHAGVGAVGDGGRDVDDVAAAARLSISPMATPGHPEEPGQVDPGDQRVVVVRCSR